MKRRILGSLLAAGVFLLLLLQACNDEQNAGEAPGESASISPGGNGEVLDGLGEDGKLPGEADDPKPGTAHEPEQKELVPPYLTISGHPFPENPEVLAGNRMWAYYELTEAPPEGAFLVMVPGDISATDAPSNLEAAVELHMLGDERFSEETETYLGSPVFQMMTPGEFVFRIFLGEGEEDEVFLESEGWRIVEADPPTE